MLQSLLACMLLVPASVCLVGATDAPWPWNLVLAAVGLILLWFIFAPLLRRG